MADTKWSRVLSSLEVTNGPVCPSTVADLDLFEKETGFHLPVSYRDYCTVFGPGELIRPWAYRIAVPGSRDLGKVELRQFNTFIRDLRPDEDDWPDPDQFRGAWFFAADLVTAWYYWDHREITVPDQNEYGIYIIYRGSKTRRLANTFEDLVTKIFLETEFQVMPTRILSNGSLSQSVQGKKGRNANSTRCGEEKVGKKRCGEEKVAGTVSSTRNRFQHYSLCL